MDPRCLGGDIQLFLYDDVGVVRLLPDAGKFGRTRQQHLHQFTVHNLKTQIIIASLLRACMHHLEYSVRIPTNRGLRGKRRGNCWVLSGTSITSSQNHFQVKYGHCMNSTNTNGLKRKRTQSKPRRDHSSSGGEHRWSFLATS